LDGCEQQRDPAPEQSQGEHDHEGADQPEQRRWRALFHVGRFACVVTDNRTQSTQALPETAARAPCDNDVSGKKPLDEGNRQSFGGEQQEQHCRRHPVSRALASTPSTRRRTRDRVSLVVSLATFVHAAGPAGPGAAAIDMTHGRPVARHLAEHAGSAPAVACKQDPSGRILPILFRPLSRSYDRGAGSRSSASPGRPAAELQRPGASAFAILAELGCPCPTEPCDIAPGGTQEPRFRDLLVVPQFGRRSPMGDTVSLRAGLAISMGIPTGTSAARPPGTAIGRM